MYQYVYGNLSRLLIVSLKWITMNHNPDESSPRGALTHSEANTGSVDSYILHFKNYYQHCVEINNDLASK